MQKVISLAIFSVFLTACMPPPLTAPIEQIQTIEPPKQLIATKKKVTSTVKNKTVLYQCSKNKTVRVTKAANSKKSQYISVTFNQTTHRLSSAVTRNNSKKYSNIRWIWSEDFNGKGTLRDKNGKILAQNCGKK
ncbi:Opacity associated protein B [Bibersteinia trehalosi USDA-ARS-USMARC-190]|uniref:Opacity associated protein B n=1 Tax=Bibersteinia trehalosi USDA-ARS-USMARC-190 TaxID=1263832 RepID=W0R922_BIBTR|nr:MliC family protein [Bibersteinia trehalosi]AHG87276.1 Opacity associated protein B [Bibersteinia trehalosi USDA-ARS-USMARC-190]